MVFRGLVALHFPIVLTAVRPVAGTGARDTVSHVILNVESIRGPMADCPMIRMERHYVFNVFFRPGSYQERK